jgi:hypothetical protein
MSAAAQSVKSELYRIAGRAQLAAFRQTKKAASPL